MARLWSGFLAQNQEVKEQWEALEESRYQIEARLSEPSEGGEFDEPGDSSLPIILPEAE